MFSSINIIGLTFGMVCVIIIALWVQNELSYEKGHEKSDNICQVYFKIIQGDSERKQQNISPVMADKLKSEYPEVDDAVRMSDLNSIVLGYKDKKIAENKGIAADKSIFNIMTLPFVEGNAQNSLDEPYSIVLTQKAAMRYFGNSSALGQEITLNNRYSFKVTGVIRDLPTNTYLNFDYIVPFAFIKELGYDIVGNDKEVFRSAMYSTYVLLRKGSDYKSLSEKISKRFSLDMKEVKFEICLVPFKDVYLEETGGRDKIMIFSLLAIIILVMGSINSINLSTAKYLTRLKEVGVRKVLGAFRKQIIYQFISESLIYSLISIVLAVLLALLILPGFNQLINKSLSLSFSNVGFIASIIMIVIFSGLVTGIYPSLFISSFNPVRLLKGSNSPLHFTSRLRKVLVISQFSLSIILIVCSLVVNKQKNFASNVNLGMNKENIIYTKLDGEASKKVETLKNELQKVPNVTSIASASSLPNALSSAFFKWGLQDKNDQRINESFVDYNYLKTFKIEMSEGRFFSKDYPSDMDGAIVVNEAAIKEVGLESPVGKPFYYGNRYYTLIGVIKNFQNNSVYTAQSEPIALRLKQSGNDYLFVKIDDNIKDAAATSQVLSSVKQICDRFSPEYPLDYKYLNEYSFEIEDRVNVFQMLVLFGTLFAILIACLGLYGLSSMELTKRTKEIGIRRVVGTSVMQILIRISSEFVRLIGISFAIACPVSYLIMDKVLQSVAYRTTLSWWIFALAGLLSILILLTTILGQTLRAASRNPVEALRCE